MNYYVFPKAVEHLAKKDIDLEVDALVALLLTSSYTYDNTDEFISDLSNEVSGGGYARQEVTVTVATVGDTITATITNSPLLFPAVTATVQFLVVAADLGADSASPLIACVDLGEQSLAGQNFVVTVPTLLEGVV